MNRKQHNARVDAMASAVRTMSDGQRFDRDKMPIGSCSICGRDDILLRVTGEHKGKLTLHDDKNRIGCPGGWHDGERVGA